MLKIIPEYLMKDSEKFKSEKDEEYEKFARAVEKTGSEVLADYLLRRLTNYSMVRMVTYPVPQIADKDYYKGCSELISGEVLKYLPELYGLVVSDEEKLGIAFTQYKFKKMMAKMTSGKEETLDLYEQFLLASFMESDYRDTMEEIADGEFLAHEFPKEYLDYREDKAAEILKECLSAGCSRNESENTARALTFPELLYAFFDQYEDPAETRTTGGYGPYFADDRAREIFGKGFTEGIDLLRKNNPKEAEEILTVGETCAK